jgi:hypothetical protein
MKSVLQRLIQRAPFNSLKGQLHRVYPSLGIAVQTVDAGEAVVAFAITQRSAVISNHQARKRFFIAPRNLF